MQDNKRPSEFLGAKTLSPLEKKRIKGGMKHHVVCQGQYVRPQQQQSHQQQQMQNPS